MQVFVINNRMKEQGFISRWICECCVAGEMFGMKFRDRELPAPPLENNPQSSMQSTKKTSVETTRKTLLETTTSKTSLETVKKEEVGLPQMSSHFLRANGRLPSCLEVRFKQDCFFFNPLDVLFIFFKVCGEPWYKPVDRKTAEEMVKKGF